MKVAPFVGAWIEIVLPLSFCPDGVLVAPFVGAWIEIACHCCRDRNNCVAPFVGAWIEILYLIDNIYSDTRRSLRGSVD